MGAASIRDRLHGGLLGALSDQIVAPHESREVRPNQISSHRDPSFDFRGSHTSQNASLVELLLGSHGLSWHLAQSRPVRSAGGKGLLRTLFPRSWPVRLASHLSRYVLKFHRGPGERRTLHIVFDCTRDAPAPACTRLSDSSRSGRPSHAKNYRLTLVTTFFCQVSQSNLCQSEPAYPPRVDRKGKGSAEAAGKHKHKYLDIQSAIV